MKVVVVMADILKKPYARMVIPDPGGGFSAEIVEFPGCFAFGETAAEALEILEEVATDWIAAAIDQGQDIPEPMDSAGYSGKLVLRMPKSLHQRATLFAERDGVSLNHFIVTCLAQRVGTDAYTVDMTPKFAQVLWMSFAEFPISTVSPSTAIGRQGDVGIFARSGSRFLETPDFERVREHA